MRDFPELAHQLLNIRFTRKRLLLILGLVIASPLVYYLASPLVISVTVSEMAPSEVSGPRTLGAGTFRDADSFHKTSGTARIIHFKNGTLLLRLEDFKATNGPDLYVYLSTGADPKDFINLGRLKGNIGEQNYLVSSNVDLQRYRYVLIWCRAFSVLFGSAEVSLSRP